MEREVGLLEGRKDTEVQESDVIGGSKVAAVQVAVWCLCLTRKNVS